MKEHGLVILGKLDQRQQDTNTIQTSIVAVRVIKGYRYIVGSIFPSCLIDTLTLVSVVQTVGSSELNAKLQIKLLDVCAV